MVRYLCLLVGFLLVAGGLVGQVEATPAESSSPTTDSRLIELQTAGYYELVDRAKELGLPVTGGVPELRSRIAQAWSLTLPVTTPSTGRTLTIDSAQEAGLVDVDAPGDGKLLRLSGGLHVTLVDLEKKVTHVIEAGELWYDQANEEMTARGRVVYTMVRDSSSEVFRGESLTFTLSDSQGIFYGGASDRSRAIEGQNLVFRYQGDAIRRSAEDLVILDTGTITSSLGSDPYYRIQAKKIWVLAPGEWGLQEAVLYLGRIPVLYFPFFFQPGDEFFFNPVLSFPEAGDRRGTSLQTTTYFLGKKKRDTAPLSFLQLEDSSTKDQEKVVKGLFLVRGTPPKSEVPSGWTLKVLADFYSNLGFLTAVDATLPGWAGTKNLTLFGGLGFTRTVGSTGLPFSANPFQSALDPWAQSDWNGSWFGSWRLPFRWGGAASVDVGWGSLSWEYYSDPLLANDLTGSRSENFSVFSLLGMGPAKKTVPASAKSSLQWAANWNPAPAAIALSLLWDSKTTVPAGISGDPENTFYLPSQLTLPQASVNWGGTLWPPAAASSSGTTPPAALALLPPGTEPESVEPTPAEAVLVDPYELVAPHRLEPTASAPAGPQWVNGANWSLRPTFKTDSRFDTAQVVRPEQSPWSLLTSRWSGSYDGRLSWNAGWSDESWIANQSFTLSQQAQDTWYLAPSVTDAQAKVYESQDKLAATGLLSQTLSSTWKPWATQGAWRDSNLKYNLDTRLWEYKAERDRFYDGTKDTVTAHQASAQAIWYLWEGVPTVKALGGWQSTLPPLDPQRTWSGSLDLSVPSAKASTRVSAKQTSSSWLWDPWDASAEWLPWDNVSLRESFQYDLENSRPISSTTSLIAWGWTVQYRHLRTTPYRFGTDSTNATTFRRWYVSGPQDFLPQELRFDYDLNLPSLQWWYHRNTLSTKVTLSWPITLQQYSSMPLNLNYTVNYKLHRFLDLQIAEGISNKTAYRYFPALTESFGPGLISSLNPLVDLWDSISFWDQAALRRTSFKMTNLSVALVHYLDDWQVKLDYSGSPQLKGTGLSQQFQWSGTLTLLVQWYPVPELKTQMQWDKDGKLSILKNSP